MLGVIERIKNAVLFKCNNLNEKIIDKDLSELINKSIYQFSEQLSNIVADVEGMKSEEELRSDITDYILEPIIKKVKRKLFIDSLALQITNDFFIEDYVKGNINLEHINKNYLKELKINKGSNQLNMTENLNLTEIFQKLVVYFDINIKPLIKESTSLIDGVNSLLEESKKELENNLEKLIKDTDKKYLEILKEEILSENLEVEEKEGNDNMIGEADMSLDYNLNKEEDVVKEEQPSSKFEQYDDMTLFNKVLLSLNTKEERLARREDKIEKRKSEVEERLEKTNKNIEANIERENGLSRRRLELNEREVKLNSKLSETEVILLNMKPLLKGLSNIKSSQEDGGMKDE